jgi:peptide-methionine (R)-S-oxide reductase
VSRLTSEQYRVTQEDATRKPFANAYWRSKDPGLDVDAVSGKPLFASVGKFERRRAELLKVPAPTA